MSVSSGPSVVLDGTKRAAVWYPPVPTSIGRMTTTRERILDAAFTALMKGGYATTSTLEIAPRARVSKRELYAVVGNKQEILIACIGERATRLKVPADLPDRKS